MRRAPGVERLRHRAEISHDAGRLRCCQRDRHCRLLWGEAAQRGARPASADRANELLTSLVEARDVIAQAKLYRAVISETGWAPVEIARRMHTDPAEINRRWDDVIYHVNVLALEPEYQTGVAGGQLSLRDAYELFRVPAAYRPALFAAFAAGKSRSAVRKLAQQLVRQ